MSTNEAALAKRALRRTIRRRIAALDPVERRRQEAALRAGCLELPGHARAATILLYVSVFPEEIDTWPLLREALASGRRLVCPRVDRSRWRLRLFRIRDLDRDLVPGTLDIPEPAEGCPEVDPAAVDWALIPGLAFDRSGYRLGRGAGHYDRLLPRLRAGTPTWALALDPQWVERLPVEPHDQPLDGILGVQTPYNRGDPSSGILGDS
jgi:5-formyltetrahydrofolate cyclo-ligase